MSQITQKGQGAPLALTASGTFQQSTDTALATLVGTRWDLNDGGEVILVGTSSATTTAAGFLYQDAALVANHQGLTVTAVQAYSNNGNTPATVTVTLGATALTANQYQGGLLVVQSSTGIGQTLRIASNPAALSSGTGVVITLEDAPNTALTTSSVVSLIPAHGANVIINPTTPSNVPVGISLYPISPSSYGFLKVKGLVGAVSDASIASVGNSIAASTTTAGTVTLFVATKTYLGSAAITAVSAGAYPVILNL